MSNIDIKDLCFTYNDKTIYDHYSVSFPKGEITTLSSPSGSGKTTLLHIISGLLKPDNGSISFDIDEPRFSMVFQDLRLIDSLSVSKNILLVNDKLSMDDIGTILKELGMDNYENKKVANLSGGEKQRVAIARALLAPYDILLLDEPYSWLDIKNKDMVRNVIERYREGRTTIVVEH